MASPVNQDIGTSTADGSNTGRSAIPISPLLSIPQEIRDEIFAYLIRAGDLAILRTSKKIHDEAKERVYREGFCNIKIGYPGDVRDSFFPKQWKILQNFRFRIYCGAANWLPREVRFWPFDRFADLDEIHPKRECRIIVDYGPDDAWASMHRDSNITERLPEKIAACLNNFKTVVVVLAPDQYKLWKEMDFPKEMRQWGHTIMTEHWMILREKLEPEFGPGKLVGGTDGEDLRLICHPQEFRRSLALKAA